ncbi:hypothetical protein [Thermococcus guaymasensis]|uniref:hypothetical protein n=1 Tax=Thermococcus guaymasensis TaxID=110164 RepID=UPI000A07921C|nr:hypothetical protein [Thermococcus guaymasensis]
MGDLRSLLRKYKAARGEEKVEIAWEIVRKASKHSDSEPFWEVLKSRGVNPEGIKDAMRFLEEVGELQIKRSIDGRRLYVSTLKDIRRNPIKLDRWLSPPYGGGRQTLSRSTRKARL